MGVGIEFDTENSCRKYQLCKPVPPQQNRNRSTSIAVFSNTNHYTTGQKMGCFLGREGNTVEGRRLDEVSKTFQLRVSSFSTDKPAA